MDEANVDVLGQGSCMVIKKDVIILRDSGPTFPIDLRTIYLTTSTWTASEPRVSREFAMFVIARSPEFASLEKVHASARPILQSSSILQLRVRICAFPRSSLQHRDFVQPHWTGHRGSPACGL